MSHAPSTRSARLAMAGRWLFLTGLFFMVTGDGPAATVGVDRWPTPVPVLAWPWLYLLLFGLSFVLLFAGRRPSSWIPGSHRFLGPALAALAIAFLLSTIFSQVPALSVRALLVVAGIAGFCWMAALAIEDEWIAGAAWPAIAAAVLCLALRVIVWRGGEGLHVVAYHVNNNAWLGKLQLAWLFNLVAPLLLARSMRARWPAALLYGGAWALAGVATYVLFSRIGSAVFVLTTLGVCLFNLTHWRKAVLVALVAAGLSAGLFVRSTEMSQQVITTILQPQLNPGVAMRLGVWNDALRLFRAHPVAGTGLGTFDDVSYTLEGSTADRLYQRAGWHAHNVYLHVLAETGLPGLLAWCYLWFAILRRLLRAWLDADAQGKLDAAGVLWAAVAFLLLSTTEVLIGARVHASLRMNLTVGFIVVLGLYVVSRPSGAPGVVRRSAPAAS